MRKVMFKAVMAFAIMAISSTFMLTSGAEAASTKTCKGWPTKALSAHYTTEGRALWNARQIWSGKASGRYGSAYASFGMATRKKTRCWSRDHATSATGKSWRCYVRAFACAAD